MLNPTYIQHKQLYTLSQLQGTVGESKRSQEEGYKQTSSCLVSAKEDLAKQMRSTEGLISTQSGDVHTEGLESYHVLIKTITEH